jgi:hypothetical protein
LLAGKRYSLINNPWACLEITSMHDHTAVRRMFQRSRTEIMDPKNMPQQWIVLRLIVTFLFLQPIHFGNMNKITEDVAVSCKLCLPSLYLGVQAIVHLKEALRKLYTYILIPNFGQILVSCCLLHVFGSESFCLGTQITWENYKAK